MKYRVSTKSTDGIGADTVEMVIDVPEGQMIPDGAIPVEEPKPKVDAKPKP